MITYERHPDYTRGLKMKKIKRPMILVGFLTRGAFLPGIALSILMIFCGVVAFAAMHRDKSLLFSDQLGSSGFMIVYSAAVVLAMAILAALISSRWFGSKSEITLQMLPVSKNWLLVGWAACGVFLLLMLTVAGHISVRLMYEIYKSERVTTTGGMVYYYEPNPVWYAFQRVGFLSWIKPAEVGEWFRYVILTLGAPIATTGLTLGILARRPARSALIAVGFILGIILAASDTDFAPVGIAIALAAAVGSAVLSSKMLNEGETV